MAEEEKKRIEDQRARLGEKGLAEKAKELEKAMEFNEVCAFIKFHYFYSFIVDAFKIDTRCINSIFTLF